MHDMTHYRILFLAYIDETWQIAPVDSEVADTLEEAREYAELMPIAIFAPGQALDETPLEQITDQCDW